MFITETKMEKLLFSSLSNGENKISLKDFYLLVMMLTPETKMEKVLSPSV